MLESLHWKLNQLVSKFPVPRTVAQRYNAKLRAGWSGVRVPAGAGNFSFHHRVQNGSGVHPTSYRIGTRGSFPEVKAGWAWSWPLTYMYCRGQECTESYLHSPNTPSWRGVQLKHRGIFTFTLERNTMYRKSKTSESVCVCVCVRARARAPAPLGGEWTSWLFGAWRHEWLCQHSLQVNLPRKIIKRVSR
jgi:hypothetical protein